MLTIWLPATTTDLKVELLAPFESSAVFTFCDPQILSVGGNIEGLDPTSVVPVFQAKNGDYKYDQVILDLGTVTNSGADTVSDVASQVEILFNAILEDNNATQYGTEDYSISAGVLYENSDSIWIGQYIFTAVDDKSEWISQSPVVSVSGPSNMSIDSSAIFEIDFTLMNYAQEVFMEVLSDNFTSDPVMTVCFLAYFDKGSNFNCMPDLLPQVSYYQDNDTQSTQIARLDLGNIVNPGLRSGNTNDEDNKIYTHAVIHLTNSAEVIENTKYWFGVAIDMDGYRIYSNQVAITAVSQSDPDMMIDPVVQFYPIDGPNVVIGGAVGFILEIHIPENTTSAFIVDFSMPVTAGGDAIMSICEAKVLYRGYNIPCAADLVPEYYREDTISADYAQFNFGRITNVGLRHQANDNLLKIHISAELLEGVSGTMNGTQLEVTAGVRYERQDFDNLLVIRSQVVAFDVQPKEYFASGLQPQLRLQNRAGSVFIYPHTAASFEAYLYIPPGTTFSPFTLNITTPSLGGKPLLSICRVSIKEIGKNFYCYGGNRTDIDGYSMAGDGPIDQYIVDLKTVSNTLPDYEEIDQMDSTFTFEVHIHWEEHPDLIQDMPINVTVETYFGMTGFETKDIQYIVDLETPTISEMDEQPQFEMYLKPGRKTLLRAGDTALFYVDIITPVNSVASYQLDVSTPNSTLSVCRNRVFTTGSNIPCFGNDIDAMYLSYEEDGHRDRAFLDLGIVRNTGSGNSSTPQENRMIAQVVVKLEDAGIPWLNWTEWYNMTAEEQATLSESWKQEFDIAALVGETDMWSTAQFIDVDPEPQSTNLPVVPEIEFEKLTSETYVTIGGAAVFNLDVYIPYDSTADYTFDFMGDQDNLYRTTICEARVVESGWNIPCVNGTFLTTTYNSSMEDEYTDMATIEAGAINNMQADLGWALKDPRNRVRVQLVVRLANNDTISHGDEFWLGASIDLNSFNIYYLDTRFYADQNVIASETGLKPTFRVYQSADNVSMTIGSREWYQIKISMPAMSTPLTINITMPTAGDEAFLTIMDVRLDSVGKNFACWHLYDEEFEPVYDSLYSTSQNTSVVVDFGVVMNHGTSHYYQYNPGSAEDDDIWVSFEIQLADHYDLTDGQLLDFDVTFDYSLGRQVVKTHYVEAVKTGLETPMIEFNLTVEDFSIYDVHPGDVVAAYAQVNHYNYSTAHAHALILNFMLPYYIEIQSPVLLEGPPLCSEVTEEGVKFHFEEVFFTDTFKIWFNFSMDPGNVMPVDPVIINTTVPVEVVYYQGAGQESDGSIILGDVFKSDTNILDLTFTVASCEDPLGMESGRIQDCQITASSSLNTSTHPYPPSAARFNSESGWAPGVRNGNPFSGNDYIQIAFGAMYRVSGIMMQKDANNTVYCDTFRVSYSEEGIVWTDYVDESGDVEIFTNTWIQAEGNDTFDDYSYTSFGTIFNARYLRILPQIFSAAANYPIMRFEVYGCKLDLEVHDLNKACPEKQFPDGISYYERGFIFDDVSQTVFVCLLEYVDGPTRCSYSKDMGVTWENIDNNVANINYLHKETLELFGLSQNHRAIMFSDDHGDNWYSINNDYFQEVLMDESLLIEATVFPWFDFNEDPELEFLFSADTFQPERTFVHLERVEEKETTTSHVRVRTTAGQEVYTSSALEGVGGEMSTDVTTPPGSMMMELESATTTKVPTTMEDERTTTEAIPTTTSQLDPTTDAGTTRVTEIGVASTVGSGAASTMATEVSMNLTYANFTDSDGWSTIFANSTDEGFMPTSTEGWTTLEETTTGVLRETTMETVVTTEYITPYGYWEYSTKNRTFLEIAPGLTGLFWRNVTVEGNETMATEWTLMGEWFYP